MAIGRHFSGHGVSAAAKGEKTSFLDSRDAGRPRTFAAQLGALQQQEARKAADLKVKRAQARKVNTTTLRARTKAAASK